MVLNKDNLKLWMSLHSVYIQVVSTVHLRKSTRHHTLCQKCTNKPKLFNFKLCKKLKLKIPVYHLHI